MLGVFRLIAPTEYSCGEHLTRLLTSRAGNVSYCFFFELLRRNLLTWQGSTRRLRPPPPPAASVAAQFVSVSGVWRNLREGERVRERETHTERKTEKMNNKAKLLFPNFANFGEISH